MFGYKKKPKKKQKSQERLVEREEDNEEFKAYIIDYGLAHSYLQKRQEPIQKKKGENLQLPNYLQEEFSKEETDEEHIENIVHIDAFSNFKGNLMFTSKNGFVVQTLSRRDDIISIIYVLIFLINGKIQKIKESLDFQDQFNIMKEFKIKTKAEEYCQEKAIYFTPILEYAYEIGFKDRPDYTKLKFMLKKMVLDLNLIPTEVFNWRKNAKNVNQVPRIDNVHLKEDEENVAEECFDNASEQIDNINKINYNYNTQKKNNFFKFQQADVKHGKFWHEKDIQENEKIKEELKQKRRIAPHLWWDRHQMQQGKIKKGLAVQHVVFYLFKYYKRCVVNYNIINNVFS